MKKTCPNCGQNVPDEYPLCPFCGTDRETGKRFEAEKPSDDMTKFQAGLVTGCLPIGFIYYLCGACYVVSGNFLLAARHGHGNWGSPAHILAQRNEYMWLGFGLPILITGLPYLLLRRRFPLFARGLGYCCLIALAIALGAPFLCKP